MKKAKLLAKKLRKETARSDVPKVVWDLNHKFFDKKSRTASLVLDKVVSN